MAADVERVDLRIEHITSPTNSTLKLARSLHRRRSRYRERAILIEGIRALTAALDFHADIQIVVLDHARRDQIDPLLFNRVVSAARRVISVDSHLFEEIADTEQPQGIIGIATMPDSRLPNDSTLVLAVDGVQDPGNLGTLIRSAAAAGADGVALLPSTVDPFSPKVVRASAGTVFAIPIGHFPSPPRIVEAAFSSRPTVVIAEGSADSAYDTHDWRQPTLLIIGGEARGASETTRTYAHSIVSIPMHAGVESLNAGVAGAILLFEAARQRRVLG
jgi:TrmH family RNA methyltransferase